VIHSSEIGIKAMESENYKLLFRDSRTI